MDLLTCKLINEKLNPLISDSILPVYYKHCLNNYNNLDKDKKLIIIEKTITYLKEVKTNIKIYIDILEEEKLRLLLNDNDYYLIEYNKKKSQYYKEKSQYYINEYTSIIKNLFSCYENEIKNINKNFRIKFSIFYNNIKKFKNLYNLHKIEAQNIYNEYNKDLNKIKVVSNKIIDNEICAITLDKLILIHVLGILPCNHVFGYNSLIHMNYCPICRRKITFDDILMIKNKIKNKCENKPVENLDLHNFF